MEWNGWNAVQWSGMEWSRWNVVQWSGMEWNRWNAVQWSEMEWSRWNAVQWSGMEWSHFGSCCSLLVMFCNFYAKSKKIERPSAQPSRLVQDCLFCFVCLFAPPHFCVIIHDLPGPIGAHFKPPQ